MLDYPEFLPKHVKTESFNLNDARFTLRERLAYYHNDEFPLLMHKHDFYELNIIVEGSGRHYITDKNFPVTPGVVFVIPPKVSHGYWMENDTGSIFHLLIEQKLLQKYSSELNSFNGYSILFETEPELRKHIASTAFFLKLNPLQLKKLTSQMDMLIEFAKYAEHKIIFETYEIALIYYLSALMEKQYNTTDIATAKKNYIFIINSTNYMKQHLSEAFSLSELAHNAMESRTCYVEKFKQLFKMTPFEYLRKLRVNQAIKLLTTTSKSVAEIAQSCGFSDSAHLIKIFKEDTGLTPSKYRKAATINKDLATFPRFFQQNSKPDPMRQYND